MSCGAIETLRSVPHPAFLWDVKRRRIVWANAAAVRFFGAVNLADLVEHPFDSREPAVRALARAARRLAEETEETLPLELLFPSVGHGRPLSAHVRPFPLEGGRAGLLVEAAEETATQIATAPVMRAILDELPQPVLAVTATGEPLYANPAALELFSSEDLASLFSAEEVHDLLRRVRHAGTAVLTHCFTTGIGKRTLRLTARSGSGDDLLILTIDDLTDRLRAERAEALIEPERSADVKPEEPAMPPAPSSSSGTTTSSSSMTARETLRRIMQALERPQPAPSPPEDGEAGNDAADETPPTPPDSECEKPRAEQTAPAAPAKHEREPSGGGERPRISIRVRRAATPTREEAPQADNESAETGPAGAETAAPAPQASQPAPQASQPAPSPAEFTDEKPVSPPETEPAPVETESETASLWPRPEASASSAAQERTQAATLPRQPSAEPGEESSASRPEPPVLVREVLDHRPEPIILHRADAFYFANHAAGELFGFAEDDPAWDDLARRLADAADGAEVTLPDVAGTPHRFRLKRDVFPWRAGVVVQSTLLPPREDSDETAAPRLLSASAGAKSDRARPADAKDLSSPQSVSRHTRAEPSRDTSQAARRVPASIIRIHTDRGDAPDTASTPSAAASVSATIQAPADELWRAVVETAADGVITLDRRGCIQSFSAGAERLFGYAAGEVLGRPFREMLSEQSRTALDVRLATLQHAEAEELPRQRSLEVTGLTKDGRSLALNLTIGCLRRQRDERAGLPATFCIAVHDISLWKRREQELRAAKDKAEQDSARKSAFLARISHELRTPLNAILGFADVLRQGLFGPLGNEKYRDYANDIHRSGEHLLSLVNDLLDLARIEAGRFELNFREVDLAAVVEETTSLLRDQISAAGVVLRRVVPEELPKVVADPRSIKQVLLNLLSNAIKFANRGDQVIVSLRQRADGALELAVKDTGPGMNAEELKAALEPFRRVSRTGENRPGTGLGLPLAKALAEANKAFFEIESEPDKGTEVRIVFPSHRVLA